MSHRAPSSNPLRSIAATILGSIAFSLAAANTGSATYLTVNSQATTPGSTITVAVSLVADSLGVSFSAIDLALSFDPAIFTIDVTDPGNPGNARVGALTSSFAGGGFSPGVGQLNFTESRGSNITLAPNMSGTVLLFELQVSNTAAAGSYAINLRADNNGTFFTNLASVSVSSIPLNPTPTNGSFDSQVDGTITVNAVPEPTSIVLMGLGGSIVLARATRRRFRPVS